MFILRIENNDGLGLYKSGHIIPNSIQYDLFSRNYHEKCIPPECDIGTNLHKFMFENYVIENGIGKYKIDDYIFGCISTKDLFEWFDPSYLGALIAIGYNICLYEVETSNIIFGSSQVCFNKNHIKSKQKVDLQKLRKLKF